jgi:UDP-N-acetylglucosamine 1-carboxyvinyltransferase
MEKFIITGGIPLRGELTLSGAKNVALKVLSAALLTNEELIIHNVPLLTDVFAMLELLASLGVHARWDSHTIIIKNSGVKNTRVSLDIGARLRTSSMVVGPLLSRYGEAIIPNPGGCRLGARPIDRHMEALKSMGAHISYHSDDGYFYLTARQLHGTSVHFVKNTHTGTETLILAAVLAHGTTIIKNAAEEVEIDGLIELLTAMGARILRSGPREITIEGVRLLHGAEYTVMPDRNEEVTFAIAAAMTAGDVIIRQSQRMQLHAFLEKFSEAGATYEEIDETSTRYRSVNIPRPTDITTTFHPGFMTDWQAPWAVFMTQAKGVSTIHETVFESRFSYVAELKKMGASISFFSPKVTKPETFYNFNWRDRVNGYHQAITITGPTRLHNAILEMTDLRAGATLVLAALVADGVSYIHGIDQVDRGYEQIDKRLNTLGAKVIRTKEGV